MARNVEIKARLQDPSSTSAKARNMADTAPVIIQQTDTFFPCAQGRLKLRDFGDGTGELIFYRRTNQAGPKVSQYAITPTNDVASLLTVLESACGVLGVVTKTRTLVMKGRTRIHLDEVAELGSFLELEVVLADDEPAAKGETEAAERMKSLGIAPCDLIQGSYLDLILDRDQQP